MRIKELKKGDVFVEECPFGFQDNICCTAIEDAHESQSGVWIAHAKDGEGNIIRYLENERALQYAPRIHKL